MKEKNRKSVACLQLVKYLLLIVLFLLSLNISYAEYSDTGNDIIDTEIPIIIIFGSDPEVVNLTSTYNDSGATATDNYDGDLTSSIVTTNTVDTTVVGTYTVTYDVTDSSGNSISVSRIVDVVDNTKPTITYSESDVIDSFGDSGNQTANIIEESDTSSVDENPLVSLPSSSTAITLGDSLTIQATISGKSSMVQVVVSFETVDYNMTQLGNSNTYEIALDTAQLPQDLGVYTYSVIAIDKNGNIGSSASILEIEEPSLFTQVLDWLTFWD